MARFDVYRNPDGSGYLLDIQANLLDHLKTRVVVPLLLPPDAPKPAARLNPRFHIEAHNVVMMTEFMAAVPRHTLKDTVGNLSAHHSDIVNAIDFLMQGY